MNMNWLFVSFPLHTYNNKFKDILIYSNIFFFILCIIILKYKVFNKDNNYIKYFITVLMIFLAGIISCIYHFNQCYNPSIKKLKFWQNSDVFYVNILMIILFILFYKNINYKIILLLAITLFIFILAWIFGYKNSKIYIYLHSLWHILIAIIGFLLILNY